MKPLYSLLFLAIFCPSISIAQSNFKPGYVVNLNGDTLRGYLNHREWFGNPKKVEFKSELNAQIQTLTPANTLFIDINGKEQYQHYSGPVTRDRVSEIRTIVGRDTSFIIDTVFVKLIHRGKNISLYSHGDDIKMRYYYTEKNSDMPKELIFRLYYNNAQVDVIKGKGRTVYENTYMKQLYELAQKYGTLDQKLQWLIEDSRYDKAYLLGIAKKINSPSK